MEYEEARISTFRHLVPSGFQDRTRSHTRMKVRMNPWPPVFCATPSEAPPMFFWVLSSGVPGRRRGLGDQEFQTPGDTAIRRFGDPVPQAKANEPRSAPPMSQQCA